MDRTARVRLHSLTRTGATRRALVEAFSRNTDAQLHWLEVAHAEAPQEPFVAYLLGRKLHGREVFDGALPVLEVARADATVPPSIRRETLRLMVEAAARLGDCDRVDALAQEASASSGPFGARARDWAARCRFTAPAPTRTPP